MKGTELRNLGILIAFNTSTVEWLIKQIRSGNYTTLTAAGENCAKAIMAALKAAAMGCCKHPIAFIDLAFGKPGIRIFLERPTGPPLRVNVNKLAPKDIPPSPSNDVRVQMDVPLQHQIDECLDSFRRGADHIVLFTEDDASIPLLIRLAMETARHGAHCRCPRYATFAVTEGKMRISVPLFNSNIL